MASLILSSRSLRVSLLRASVPVRRCASGRLADELARLGDRVARADGAQRQQAGALDLAQRQQAVLERRVAALEEAEARLARRVAEAARIASDVALQHRGVEELVQQVERLVLDRPALQCAEDVQSIGRDTEQRVEHEAEQRVGHNIEQRVGHNIEQRVGHGTEETDRLRERVADLGRQVEALQARVELITLEKIVADRVQTIVQPHKNLKGDQAPMHEKRETGKAGEIEKEAVHAVSAAVDRVSGGAGPRSLAEILRHSGAFPFKDNTGATRVSSQRILVRGVPLTCGAAEVRVLCARVGQVVSCVVRQASTVATGARYRSQESEDVAAEQTDERAFEVTFRSAEEAVRAVLQLNGHTMQKGAVLGVEPLVSADIIAALQQLEEMKKGTRDKK